MDRVQIAAWLAIAAFQALRLWSDAFRNPRAWAEPVDAIAEQWPLRGFVVSRRAFVFLWRPLAIAMALFVVLGVARF